MASDDGEHDVRTYFVTVGPWRLHVMETGPEDGAPIVLVHGLGTSAATWRHNMGRLATCGRVLAVDLPGFGRSDTPRSALCADQLALVLAAWCRRMALDRARFVGHSLGGEVCLWLASRHPELVEALVLAGSTGATNCPPLAVQFGRLVWDAVLEPRAFMPVLMKAYWQSGPRRIYRTARASDPRKLAEHLAAVTAPTCVLWGANDPVIPLAEARQLTAALPNAHLVVVADGAHGLIFDAPDTFNRAVCAFFGELTEAGRTCRAPGSDDAIA